MRQTKNIQGKKQKSIIKRTLFATLLLLVAVGVKAQAQYVFINGNNYYYVNNNTWSYTNAFSPSVIWSINNNVPYNNNRYLIITRGGYTVNRTYTPSLNQNTSGTYTFTISDGEYVNYGGRYLATTLAQMSTTTNASSRIIAYQVTTTAVSSISTAPTISGNNVITATGNTPYTASGAAYRVGGYTNYRFNNADHYFSGNTAITPANATIGSYTWELTPNSYATVNSSGVVNVSSLPEIDVTLTLTATATATGGNPAAPAGTTLSGSKEITIQGTKPSAPVINASGTTVTLSTDAAGTTSIRYTLDGTAPTATTGTVYNAPIDISSSTTSPVIIKAVTVRNGIVSTVTEKSVTLTLAEPTITINGEAKTATISCSTPGATIYYTTDGSTPTTSSSQYTGVLSGIAPMTTIKAIAVKDGWNSSSEASALATIPSGVSGSTVTLFDYEDHNWTYYKGVDTSVDGGNYNTNYIGKIYSPNPRNVQITYKGVNGVTNSNTSVRVSIDEDQTSFVYYKTLEQGNTTSEYPYQVISNPFSVRPSTGTGNSKVYYGFAGWKIVSGGEYIKNHNNNDVLSLDEEIVFNNLPYPSVNCTSAQVVFETTWKIANRTYVTNNPNNNQTYNTAGDYESNFYVINCNYSRNITASGPVTITMVEPDGSSDYRDKTFTGNIIPDNNGVTKIEWAQWNSNATVDAKGRYMTIGRGVTNSQNGWELRGNNSNNTTMNQVFKIESGKAQTLHGFSNSPSSVTKQQIILGCDYDRASGNNNNMEVTGYVCYASATPVKATSGDNISFLIKSGKYLNNAGNGSAGTSTYCMYMWYNGGGGSGSRSLTVEGGEIRHIAGGYDNGNNQDDVNLRIRVKGGIIRGVVFGGAAKQNTYGGKCLVFTGGTVEGWIAGASNGFEEANNGTVEGATYVYVGGKTIVGTNNSVVTNASTGGNIYGAGCGRSAENTSGRATKGTNIVFGDQAYVRSGVYGGGAYGYCPEDQTANVYITGGTVEGIYDTTYKVNGGVYGGARQNRGGTINLYMTGGQVNSGVYGGSNAIGTISGNVTMKINGGQVGTTSNNANIHGGGYGEETRVNGNVSLTLGTDGQTTQGVTVYGDVYGGSALGIVNTNASNSTNVTMNAGKVYGSVYGGGLGDATHQANVNGTVTVVVNGGSVKEVAGKTGSGAVYGCNNVSGRPMQNDVTVTVNGTDAAADGEYAIDNVFGGGNAAAYIGNPVVTIAGTKTNCVVGNVYGGGLGSTATVTGNSTVKMNNGRAKNLFGGGSQADLTGGVTMSVTGGRVDNDVYGGGALADTNTSGGTTSVSLTGGTVGNAYGGGLGAKTGINGATADVEAIVNGNVTVEVNGTAFLSEIDSEGIVTKGRVFGCNNLNGTPKGTVTVHVYKTVGLNGADKPERNTNKYEIQAVYGGGNLAAYQPTASNTATKVIIDGCGLSSIAYVYGGGNAAPVPATNVTVNGSYEIDYVFGGGNGKDKILINGVYEENPGADVGKVNGVSYGTTDPIGTTTTTIYGGVIHHVFGGSNTKGDVTKEAHVILGDQNLQTCEFKVGEVYGAGNEAYMSGSANIKLNCIEGLTEIYGGSRRADIDKDVNLTINGGRYEKVFGGNNESGCIRGSITVTIQENGCLPIYIDELYLGGNEAAYSVYGYNDDKSPKTEGTALYGDPVLNVISATEIGAVYGGGLGNTAIMYGNPHVNINMEPGKVNGKYKYVATNTEHPEAVSPAGYDIYDEIQNTSATFPLKLSLGNIGTVFGGGNAAKVVGDTHIQIGTGLAADGTTALKQTDDPTQTRHDAQISRNVYGGGNQAEVTGKTNVVIGHE